MNCVSPWYDLFGWLHVWWQQSITSLGSTVGLHNNVARHDWHEKLGGGGGDQTQTRVRQDTEMRELKGNIGRRPWAVKNLSSTTFRKEEGWAVRRKTVEYLVSRYLRWNHEGGYGSLMELQKKNSLKEQILFLCSDLCIHTSFTWLSCQSHTNLDWLLCNIRCNFLCELYLIAAHSYESYYVIHVLWRFVIRIVLGCSAALILNLLDCPLCQNRMNLTWISNEVC